jgi:hypothetical protein
MTEGLRKPIERRLLGKQKEKGKVIRSMVKKS